MISLRLMGPGKECEAFADMLSEMFTLKKRSDPVPNRNTDDTRIYIEIEKKEFMGSVDSLPGEIYVCHEPYCDTCYNCGMKGRCRWEP